MSKLTAPRGTFDILPEQARVRVELERVARELLEAAGYERIETPTFEATELFVRGAVSRPTSCRRRCTASTTAAGDR